MKSLIFKLLLICLIPTSLMAQDWNTIKSFSTGQTVKDVCWINETTAYAVSALYDGTDLNVKKTSDGGVSWVEQYAGNPSMSYYEIASPNNGGDVFIVGNSGTLLHTNDGGENWSNIDIGTTLHLRDIFFLSNSIGYIGADAANIFKTTDGGMTWANLNANTPVSGSVNKICFVNESIGYIAGLSYFFETVDGGLNWTYVPGFEPNGENYQIQDLQFLDENVGYISGDVGLFFKTTDAGVTWVDKQVVIPDNPNASLFSFKFLDSYPSIGFACGYSGLLIRTYDAGDTWELMASDVSGTNEPDGPIFYALDFYEDHGLMVGPSKILEYVNTTSSTSEFITKDELIKLYPNPVNDILTFTVNDKIIDEVQVIDINGKVCKVITNPVINNIQCGDLLKGKYILKIISEKTISHKLFIKN